MNGNYLSNTAVSVQYAFKKDGKGERHGDEAERLLASKARVNIKDAFLGQPNSVAQMFAQAAAPSPVSATPQPQQGGYDRQYQQQGGAPPPLPAGFDNGQDYNNASAYGYQQQQPPHQQYDARPSPYGAPAGLTPSFPPSSSSMTAAGGLPPRPPSNPPPGFAGGVPPGFPAGPPPGFGPPPGMPGPPPGFGMPLPGGLPPPGMGSGQLAGAPGLPPRQSGPPANGYPPGFEPEQFGLNGMRQDQRRR
jgi:splicing factor 3B subunit 4